MDKADRILTLLDEVTALQAALKQKEAMIIAMTGELARLQRERNVARLERDEYGTALAKMALWWCQGRNSKAKLALLDADLRDAVTKAQSAGSV